MQKQLLTVILLILMLSAYSLDAEEKVIRVGLYHNEPKIYVDEQGKPAGIFIDILNKIAKNEGWELNYVFDEWDNCLEALKNGTIDIMPDVAFSLERAETFVFNKNPLIHSWSQVYVKQNSEINTLADLEDKRIALLTASIQQNVFTKMMKGFGYDYIKVPAKSFEEAFSAVKKDLADAAIANHFYGESHHAEFGLLITSIVFNPVALHFATAKGGTSEILNTIDRYIEEWLNTPNSHYYKTLSKYHKQAIVQPLSKLRSWLLVIIIALLIIATVIILMLRRHLISKIRNWK